MRLGTRSVLFGAHCFFLHPFFVAYAWWKLFGFPWHPLLWLAFFVHDLGYIGKPNMDGAEGETHPEFGAGVMAVFDPIRTEHIIHRIPSPLTPMGFDYREVLMLETQGWVYAGRDNGVALMIEDRPVIGKWSAFCLYHSRFYAKKAGAQPSRLCFADKMAFVHTPRWLYLPMTRVTGELYEYLADSKKGHSKGWVPTGDDAKLWHAQVCTYMTEWVQQFIDGSQDTWTKADRGESANEAGVWK